MCPSTFEITTRLRSIIYYTEYLPQSRSSIGPSEAKKAELKSLQKMFTQVPDEEGVEINDANGIRIKLIGRDLGRLAVKRSHQSAILLRHNEHLREQGITEFPLPVSIPLSRLDWAVFEGCPSR